MNDSAKLRHDRDIHLSYYLNFAENASSPSSTERDATRRYSLNFEIDNFRAALDWAIENGDQERGLRLGIALEPVWNNSGHLLEGKSWLTRMLNKQSEQYPLLRAKAMIQSAKIAQNMGDFEQAIKYSKLSLRLCEVLDYKPGIGLSLLILGIVQYLNGEFERGVRLLNKSLSIFRETGDEKYETQALIRIADVNMRRGMLDQASNLFQQALLIASRLNDKTAMGFSSGGLGDINRFKGRYKEAFEYYRKSLLIHWEENDKSDLPFVLEALAMNYAALDIMDQAVVLWGAADSIREEIQSPLPPSYQKAYSPIIHEIRSRLGEAKFYINWREGRSASLDQIISNSISLTNAPDSS